MKAEKIILKNGGNLEGTIINLKIVITVLLGWIAILTFVMLIFHGVVW